MSHNNKTNSQSYNGHHDRGNQDARERNDGRENEKVTKEETKHKINLCCDLTSTAYRGIQSTKISKKFLYASVIVKSIPTGSTLSFLCHGLE